MTQAPLALLAALIVPALCCVFLAGTARANVRVCQGQEQHYEQIKASAGPLEINAALAAAADKGCLTLARRLLEDGASLQARDRLGAMPLSRAAKAGNADIVELFLARGAAINARNLDGSTALFLAAEADNRAVVETLLAHGADINLPGRSGLTPIAAAAYMGNEPLVRLLAGERRRSRTQPTALARRRSAMRAGRGFTSVVRLLLDHGVDVNARYGNDLTALMWAAGHADEAGTADVDEPHHAADRSRRAARRAGQPRPHRADDRGRRSATRPPSSSCSAAAPTRAFATRTERPQATLPRTTRCGRSSPPSERSSSVRCCRESAGRRDTGADRRRCPPARPHSSGPTCRDCCRASGRGTPVIVFCR